MANTTTFKVGDITFADFEVPQELSDLGGEQMVAKHVFSGGDVSIQTFGDTPAVKKWSGILFGQSAESRAQQFKKLYTSGQAVTMTYSSWQFRGVVTNFEIVAKYQYEIHYSAQFDPVEDLSTPAQAVSLAPAIGLNLPQMQQITQQQATAPASGASLPSSIQQGVTQVNNSITSALNSNNGNLANVPSALLGSVQSQIGSLLTQLAPMISGVDPVAASAAADLSSSLTVVNTILNQQTPPLAVVTAVNPNLIQLASAYYGDPTKWELIASANNLVDYSPIGLLSLTIPVDNTTNTDPTLAYAPST